MTTKVDEIAPRIYRLSALVSAVAPHAQVAHGAVGSSFTGDCAGMLDGLADAYRERITAATA